MKADTRKSSTQPFIVADTETVLVDNEHVPYAVGFLVVLAGADLSSKPYGRIESYFSEDYLIKWDSFAQRSKQMFSDFIERLVVVCSQNLLIRTVYFHNLSRFDGRIILNHLVDLEMYTFQPLIRNGSIYEIKVYLRKSKSKRLLFRLVDSLLLLTGSLDSLSKNLCPELGSKGSIEYDKINVSNLKMNEVELVNYMKQDILLLGGVMLKAQEIYWSIFKIDIVTKLTLSSLSLSIFRMHYYDQKNWSIHIPTRNEDTFIRRGFYGGHTDVYIHEGENLYHYDVNSLYPYIMKTFPIPGGKPQWKDALNLENLDNLFGFLEAYVECPKTMKRPFLPYREKNKDTLIFPTGSWIGVYYSEELKYARDKGYQIIPLRGYLFDNKNSSPFGNFVDELFKYRQEAKKAGNSDLSYIYKILMNSLYGRFGINPISMKA